MSDCPPGCSVNLNIPYLREKYGQTVVKRVHRLANIRVRIAKYRSHLFFNHRCKENKVLPPSLRFRPPIRSVKGYKLMENTGFSFLRLRIDQCHQFIQSLSSLFSRSLSELSALIDHSEIAWVEEFCCSKEQQTSIKQRERHDKKLRLLFSKKSPDNSGSTLKDKWVLKLSSKELSALERSGLEKGLKFAVAPSKIPTAEIVAAVEEGISRLNVDQKHLIRAEVSSILRRAKPPPKNISNDVFKALLALKKDPDRLVLSADKGNCVVVMDKQQYDEKASSLLSDRNTYSILKSDPTSKTQRKLNKMLLDLKKAGKISESTYKMLYSSDGLCPRFYGLPKIHKTGIPLRPIVSFVNSPTYAVSSYLAKILSPVVGNTDYTVKNSCDFADFIRGKTLDAGNELVSFDVVSLFTKIPVDLAISVAEKRLKQDASLGQRTSLPVEDLIDLLSFCLNTTQFAYNGTYYQQVFGTAMGSPVSAVIANMVMEDVEQRALASSPIQPLFWKRYVDDVISAVSGNEAERLLSHLNSVEPSIQFTIERENDRRLSFLDLNVYRAHRGNLETSVYRKPTHTDKYLAFDSHHPICHKKSVTRTLLTRADCLPSSCDSRAKERKYVFDVLKVNGYPNTFLRNCLKPVTPSLNTSGDEVSATGFAVIPYIRGVTEPIKRVLSSHNVKVAQKPFQTLSHIFAKPKDPVLKEQRTDAVYSIPCNDCDHEYIGQTKRQLGTRLKEHQKAVFLCKKENSALSEHACQTNHTIAWDNSKIITTNRRYHQRLCLEAWHINSAHAPLNRDDGGLLPDTYLHLIKTKGR